MAEVAKVVELGEAGGVAIAAVAAGYEVKFKFDRHVDNAAYQGPGQDEIKSITYDPQLVKMMRTIEGAAFDKNSGVWAVPEASAEALANMAVRLRAEIKAIAVDRDSIFDLAGMSAEAKQKENKSDSKALPRVSDYLAKGESHNGEIINANGRFAAQFTGFGKDDGAAFVTVHRTAALDKPLMKGDVVGIKYADNGLGAVTDRSQVKSMDEMLSEFDGTLGTEHSGVTVTVADKFLVAFDFNPVMKSRIQRIADVEFDKVANAFSVPLDAKEFVVRAVADMRNEFVADGKEVIAMKAIAETKIDGAKVYPAFTKDGQEHFGAVLEVGDRYVLQKGGIDQFKLHHRESLDVKTVEKGQNLLVKYNKGIGAVTDLTKQKEQSKAVSR